jgi:regulator of ribonuclease activity B
MGLFGKRKEQPVDPEERSPRLGVKYKDLLVMNQLMQAGADLSRPRHVIHFFYSRDIESAQALAEAVREQPAWETKVREPLPEYPGQWGVICETRAVVTADFVRDTGNLFDSLAATYRADYDGWEVAV